MEHSNRRDFLKKAAVGSTALGAGLTLQGLTPRRTFAQGQNFKRIAYRQLGSTGFLTSEIGMGCMNMRDSELVHAAIDNGINYIDTAHAYMNGENEQVVGTVMKSKRDKVFLTTKLKWQQPENVMTMMELSLKRLQTDHVDLVLMHVLNDRESVLREDLMDAFVKIRDKGYTRFIGVSTHSNQAEVIDAAIESKLWEALLIGYSYMSPPNVKEAIARARQAGLATIGMKNLINTSVRGRPPLEDIRSDEDKKNMSPQQALLKWVLEDSNLDNTIPGMTSFEQLADDLDIMSMKMSFEDRENRYRYSSNDKRGTHCLSVAGCTDCLDKCPKGMQMCDLNRCIGYAEGYGDIALAHENYRNLPSTSKVDVCSDCDVCKVKCTNGLNLTESVNTARHLFS